MAIYTPGRETDDIYLASALLTIGVPCEKQRPFRTIELAHARAPKWLFYFAERSKCGRFETDKLIKVWDDPLWMRSNENHPWAWLWRHSRAHQECLYAVKNTPPLVEHDVRGLKGFLSLNATQEQQDYFYQRLADRAKRGHRTKMKF